MGTFSDEIFIAMREDYESRGKDSFLFRYFSEKRAAEGKAEKKGKAKQVKTKGKQKKNRPEQTEEKIVHRMVRDKMYNLGFPLKTSDIIPPNDRRLISKELDMVSSWIDEGNSTGTGQSSAGPDLASFQKLYESLNDEKRESALIPVVIESDTGRGICIVGKTFYNKFPKEYEKLGRSCGISFMEWDEDRTGGDITSLKITFTETEEVFPTIYEAYAWLLKNKGDEKYDLFRAYNGDMPEDTPEKYRKYFEGGAEEENEITEEDELESRKEIEQGLLQR